MASTPIIIDGRKARDFYRAKLIERVRSFAASAGMPPRLAIIQVGDNADSTLYIGQKKKFGIAIGAAVDHLRFPEGASQSELAAEVARLNSDPAVHGIIVQLPVPAHIDKLALINQIDPSKDVDGLTDANQRLLDAGTPRLIPATAKGIMLLLDFYGIDCKGARAAVFGRSRLVGHPMAKLLEIRGAQVSVIHSQTADPKPISRAADIVVVAVGKKGLVDQSYLKPGAVVIDVGTQGDVDRAAVSGHVSAISPVPGGVGPMTVLSLFDNLIVSAENSG